MLGMAGALEMAKGASNILSDGPLWLQVVVISALLALAIPQVAVLCRRVKT